MRILIQPAGDGTSFDLIDTSESTAPLIATAYDWITAVKIQVMLEALADLPLPYGMGATQVAEPPGVTMAQRRTIPRAVPAAPLPSQPLKPTGGPPPLPTDASPAVPFRPTVLGPSMDAEPVTPDQEKGDSPKLHG